MGLEQIQRGPVGPPHPGPAPRAPASSRLSPTQRETPTAQDTLAPQPASISRPPDWGPQDMEGCPCLFRVRRVSWACLSLMAATSHPATSQGSAGAGRDRRGVVLGPCGRTLTASPVLPPQEHDSQDHHGALQPPVSPGCQPHAGQAGGSGPNQGPPRAGPHHPHRPAHQTPGLLGGSEEATPCCKHHPWRVREAESSVQAPSCDPKCSPRPAEPFH